MKATKSFYFSFPVDPCSCHIKILCFTRRSASYSLPRTSCFLATFSRGIWIRKNIESKDFCRAIFSECHRQHFAGSRPTGFGVQLDCFLVLPGEVYFVVTSWYSCVRDCVERVLTNVSLMTLRCRTKHTPAISSTVADYEYHSKMKAVILEEQTYRTVRFPFGL